MGKLLKSMLCLIISASLLLNSGCIHVSPTEVKSLNLVAKNNLDQASAAKSELRFLVYQPGVLPLQKFFSNLYRGKYVRAFEKIDLRYQPSNVDNQVLQELIDAGFIPVYIDISNNDSKDLKFEEKNFILTLGEYSQSAIKSHDIPKEFEHFSPKALAANTFNTGVIVVAFAAALVAVALILAPISQGSPLIFHGGGGKGGSPRSSYGNSESDEIYNDLNRVTKVDYQDYLISSTTLKPGQSRQGLIFFFAPDVPRDQDFQLVFK